MLRRPITPVAPNARRAKADWFVAWRIVWGRHLVTITSEPGRERIHRSLARHAVRVRSWQKTIRALLAAGHRHPRRQTACSRDDQHQALRWFFRCATVTRSGISNSMPLACAGLYPYAAYEATKAGVVALTEQLALQNAPFGIRVNCILPGLIETSMAVETRSSKWNKPRDEVMAEREAKVPLGRQETGWTSLISRSSWRRTRPRSSPASPSWSSRPGSQTASECRDDEDGSGWQLSR